MNYSIQKFKKRKGLLSLAQIWADLSSKDSKSNLFNSYEWISCWIKTYWQSGYFLDIAVVKNSYGVVALIPLYFNSQKEAYYCLGTGEPEVSEVSSEYVDILVNEQLGDLPQLYKYIAHYLQSLKPGKIEIVNCLENSHVHKITAHIKYVSINQIGNQYTLKLKRDFENILDGFSKNLKKRCRLLLNRYRNDNSLSLRILSSDDSKISTNDFKKYWEVMKFLHQSDWRARGKRGAFTTKEFDNFHLCMNRKEKSDHLFSILLYNDEIIAINIYYIFNGIVHYYQSGSVKDVHKRLSPGIMLHILTIRSICKEYKYYDFMKGRIEESYKNKFCAPGASFYDIQIYGTNISGYIMYHKDKIMRYMFKHIYLRLIKRFFSY